MNKDKDKNIINSNNKKKWILPKIVCIPLIETYSDPYDPGRENGHGQFSGTNGPS